MTEAPSVTVLIPARNEEVDIERCLRAVLAQDHPHDRMEIIVVDGGSTDETAGIASGVLAAGDIDWQIIDNPTRTTPSNLNAGLARAAGEILCRVDARSVVPCDYVSRCCAVLTARSEVAVTGGAQVAVSVEQSVLARGIERALNNRYAMGGSRYRSGRASGPTDTVYLGAFRTQDLRVCGGWDERLHTNQDFDLNRRLSRRGVVWFDSQLAVGYVPRRTLRALWNQYHRFGRWKVRYWRISGDRPRPRQYVPIVGMPVGVGTVVALTVRHRARGVVLASAGGACALVLLDSIGSASPAPASVRSVGAFASGLIATAWVLGVYWELMTGLQAVLRDD